MKVRPISRTGSQACRSVAQWYDQPDRVALEQIGNPVHWIHTQVQALGLQRGDKVVLGQWALICKDSVDPVHDLETRCRHGRRRRVSGWWRWRFSCVPGGGEAGAGPT